MRPRSRSGRGRAVELLVVAVHPVDVVAEVRVGVEEVARLREARRAARRRTRRRSPCARSNERHERSLRRVSRVSAAQTRGARHRQLAQADAHRGRDGVRDRGGRGDDGRLADALRAERAVGRGNLDDERVDVRHALGGRDRVVEERAREQAARPRRGRAARRAPSRSPAPRRRASAPRRARGSARGRRPARSRSRAARPRRSRGRRGRARGAPRGRRARASAPSRRDPRSARARPPKRSVCVAISSTVIERSGAPTARTTPSTTSRSAGAISSSSRRGGEQLLAGRLGRAQHRARRPCT